MRRSGHFALVMLGWLLAGLLAGLLAMSAAAAAPADAVVQIHGQPAGQQQLRAGPDGEQQAEFRYQDRGRGEQLSARWRLDARGLPVTYDVSGHDYWLAPVAERFERSGGQARWQDGAAAGETEWPAAGAFYLPAHAPPEFKAVLVRALLKAPGQRLRLLPAGEAWLEQAGGAGAPAGLPRLQLHRIGGIEFMPVPVWLDAQGRTAAVVDDWFEVLPAALRPQLARLQAAQRRADERWHAALAQRLAHRPRGPLLIRHARLFDPRDLGVREGQSVLVQGERIVRVDDDARLEAPPGAEVIDAADRFLMPGLWDVHQHFSGVDGILDLIAGVTSARDLANDNQALMARVRRFDAGTEIGPRVLMAGIIEGTGPLAGPTDVKVATPAAALKAVDWYAAHGYRQVKIYSSLPPPLVRVVADRAHALGLRVSGHVPAFMRAQQFIEDGADEIQHLNFIVLNFAPEVADTRSRDRYTRVAEKLQALRLDDPVFTDFVALLRRRHTVLDPTLSLLEGLYAGEPGLPAPGLREIAARLPPNARRQLAGSAVLPPVGQEDSYRQALPALQRLLKALHDAGVPLMPGTDALAGYSLQRELALYVQAGIAPAEVLRLATLLPAQVLGVAHERGVIAPGRLADMVLIDGDPLADIDAIKRVYRTVKGGVVYDPAALEQALGLLPR
ncbi:amidohydrolase family protein [Aquabacterium sp.]|uniref:amidohydrolase family protein n=1 Tax=Aquabacterium sp. TaxID=1872578 RepID=UPI003784F2DB